MKLTSLYSVLIWAAASLISLSCTESKKDSQSEKEGGVDASSPTQVAETKASKSEDSSLALSEFSQLLEKIAQEKNRDKAEQLLSQAVEVSRRIPTFPAAYQPLLEEGRMTLKSLRTAIFGREGDKNESLTQARDSFAELLKKIHEAVEQVLEGNLMYFGSIDCPGAWVNPNASPAAESCSRFSAMRECMIAACQNSGGTATAINCSSPEAKDALECMHGKKETSCLDANGQQSTTPIGFVDCKKGAAGDVSEESNEAQ